MQHAWQVPKPISQPEPMDAKETMRNSLKEMLKRVPAKVNSGTIQDARQFKLFYEKAQRVIGKPRATESEITSIYNQAIAFYL